MRFTSKELPPSEFIADYESVCALAEEIRKYDNPIGFDTETDGLGYRVKKSSQKEGAKDEESQAGDGLGADLQVICLCFSDRRIAVPTWGEYRRNQGPLVDTLLEKQSLLVCYNAIFDYNVVEFNHLEHYGESVEFTDMWCDGLLLWRLWDEDGEHTSGQRGLKARSRFWTSLPMNSFDDQLIKNGGVKYGFETEGLFDKTLDYCTRDAFAHLSLGVLGRRLAEKLPWAPPCPHCGEPCMESANFQRDPGDQWRCREHGWVKPEGDLLTMWQYHQSKEVPFQIVLKRMEQRGLLVDHDLLESYIEPLRQAMAHENKEFQRAVGEALRKVGAKPREVSMSSSAQIQDLYYKDKDPRTGEQIGLGYPAPARTKSGGGSTAEEDLKKLRTFHDAPGVDNLLRYKKMEKVFGTYVLGLRDVTWSRTGRVHSRIRNSTVTTRIASNNPNATNLPAKPVKVELPPTEEYLELLERAEEMHLTREEAEQAIDEMGIITQSRQVAVDIRRSVVAPEGESLICADFAQLEVRLGAIESGDKNLIKVINEGLDMHCFTAAEAYGDLVPDLTYDLLFEAKQFSDGDVLPRASTLSLGREDLVDRFTVAFDTGELDISRIELDGNIQKALAAREALLRVKGVDTIESGIESITASDAWEDYCSALGFQDGRLLNYRSGAKSAIFGIMYGIGPTGLAVQITMNTGRTCTKEVAALLIDRILGVAYPDLGRHNQRLKESLAEMGYVRNRVGIYRHPAGVHSGDPGKRARTRRQIVNFPIQSLAAAVMVEVMTYLEFDPVFSDELGGKLLMQVHDELLASAPADRAEEALDYMVSAMQTQHGLDSPVPLKATGSVAKTWADAK